MTRGMVPRDDEDRAGKPLRSGEDEFTSAFRSIPLVTEDLHWFAPVVIAIKRCRHGPQRKAACEDVAIERRVVYGCQNDIEARQVRRHFTQDVVEEILVESAP